MDKISVIIPTFNSAKTINRCISSVLAQTYKNYEVILVDDGSTDNTFELLKQFAADDKRFVLVSKTNGGVSSARNAGLRVATGKYVQFVDSDDDIEPYMFERMLTVMTESDADVVTCRFKHDCWKPYLPAGEYHMKDRTDCLRFFSDFFTFNIPWNKLIKRELIARKFNESVRIFEDGLFTLENFVKINKIIVLEDVLYNYYNAAQDAESTVNAFLKTRFWETQDGYWFRFNKIKGLFSNALQKLKFRNIESFIRTRTFDMAFIELVKLIASGVSEEICCHEMFAIFSQADFHDSLKLFSEKPFLIAAESVQSFVKKCFKSYRRIMSETSNAEPFFEYIECFFSTFCNAQATILDAIAERLMIESTSQLRRLYVGAYEG